MSENGEPLRTDFLSNNLHCTLSKVISLSKPITDVLITIYYQRDSKLLFSNQNTKVLKIRHFHFHCWKYILDHSQNISSFTKLPEDKVISFHLTQLTCFLMRHQYKEREGCIISNNSCQVFCELLFKKTLQTLI